MLDRLGRAGSNRVYSEGPHPADGATPGRVAYGGPHRADQAVSDRVDSAGAGHAGSRPMNHEAPNRADQAVLDREDSGWMDHVDLEGPGRMDRVGLDRADSEGRDRADLRDADRVDPEEPGRLDHAGSDRVDHEESSSVVRPARTDMDDAGLTGVEYPAGNAVVEPDHPGTMIPADDGCRLWTDAVGEGEAVILCHGGPGLWDMFGDLAAMLATRLRVIRWDQRGCARSERRGPYSLAQAIADLDAVRRGYGLRRVAVLGHSWGATLALHYALAHPARVTKLVYVSGTGLGRAWHPAYERNLAARLGQDLRRLRDAGTPAEDRPRVRGRSARTPAGDRELAVLQWSADFPDPATARTHAERMATPWFPINYDCNTVINTEEKHQSRPEGELVAACRALPTPTLIVDGDQDIRPRWAVDSLHAALPTVTRVTLPGVGHVPWLEDPDAVAGAVLDFLAPQRQTPTRADS